ncbi:hypothetical protein [Fimbriiglobus ruber]|nr:hypothetical protein [Fimbriiglobus ruber]
MDIGTYLTWAATATGIGILAAAAWDRLRAYRTCRRVRLAPETFQKITLWNQPPPSEPAQLATYSRLVDEGRAGGLSVQDAFRP